jgi:diphthamide biosynthesis enzyme Dph1/Dph2-like protein
MAITSHATIENETYDLQLDDTIKQIQEKQAKMILIQLPDGLKQYANEIRAVLNRECPDAQLVFWADSCFGACDAPIHVRHLGFDMLIAFGHAPWRS